MKERTMSGKIKRSIKVGLFLYLFPFMAMMLEGIPQINAVSFDDTAYQEFLDRHVVQGKQIGKYRLNVVDYDTIYRGRNDRDSLYRKILSQLAVTDPDTLETPEEKIAFWINAYNIGAIKMIIDHYPVESIRSREISWVKSPWDKKILTVGGREYSLGEIEHEILLGRFKEPLAHFAIVCASLSCPELSPRAYKGASLMEQLEAQARDFLNDREKGLKIDRKNKDVYFTQIFKFDKKTFPKGAEDALSLIGRYLGDADREYLVAGGYRIRYLEYDWSLNTLKNVR